MSSCSVVKPITTKIDCDDSYAISSGEVDYSYNELEVSKMQNKTSGFINGAVVDEAKQGIEFTNLVLYQAGMVKSNTNSGDNGFFKLENIPVGTYDLNVTSLGYRTLCIEGLLVKGGQELQIGPIVLKEEPQLLHKPIIYLYPESKQKIEISLDYDGEITHSYPKYENGWRIEAYPDGTLIDQNNKEYYALYWEGKPNEPYSIESGNVVSGNQPIEFLENALHELGLNRKEANEFIIYWLPKLENNSYNLLHFSTKEYEEKAKMKVIPEPETMIRLMMIYTPLRHPIKIKQQNLEELKKERKGFTVVEWVGYLLPEYDGL